MAVSSGTAGYTIPPYAIADSGSDQNRCKNDGCGRHWVRDKDGILRCPVDPQGNRTCGLKLAKTIEYMSWEKKPAQKYGT